MGRWRRLEGRLSGRLSLRALRRYLDRLGGTWATLIAWNLLFAFFPMAILAIGLLGFVLQDPGATALLRREIRGLLPGSDGRQVVAALDAFRQHRGILAGVGTLGLIWSGSGLFGAMDQGLSTLAGRRPRGFVSQKRMAVAMIVVFTALAGPVVLSSSLLAGLASLPQVPRGLAAGPLALILQAMAGVVVGTLLFAIVYVVVPNRRHRVRRILPGAVTAGVLLEGFTLLFPLTFRLERGFATYGQTFALFFLVLFFAFAVGQITVLGYCVALAAEPPPADGGRAVGPGGPRGPTAPPAAEAAP